MSRPGLEQADFAYAAPANDAAGLPLALSIFADRLHLRAQMREDAEAAGFRITEVAGLASLLEGEARALGEVVLLDCPDVGGAALAALARLDMRAAHCGAQLIVSTSVDALDDVFACMDQANPQILVDPGRADRLIALGRVLARFPNPRLRVLSEADRMLLLRLTEQVDRIAERLDRLSALPVCDASAPDENSAFRVEAPRRGFSGSEEEGSGRSLCARRPPLPDPQLVRRIIRQRQLRAHFLDGDLFADPAWDMTSKIFGKSIYFKEAA